MIKTENLSYVYDKGLTSEKIALDNVNLEINDGLIVALIGHTGSGKSTLIQHFNALMKATSGKIMIDGTDITSPSVDLKYIRKTVGLVFQYPEHQLFEETVYKDIAFGPKNMGFSDEETDFIVRESIKAVGLDEKYLVRSPFELSGGQKRRVAIAGVLAMKPKVLILDEPTAGLDPKGRDEILNLIKRLHKDNEKMIIIFVSHSMEDVANIAESIIVMNKGRVQMHGSVDEVFSKTEELEKIGLAPPQVTMLANKLRLNGYDMPNVYTVEAFVKEIVRIYGGEKNA